MEWNVKKKMKKIVRRTLRVRRPEPDRYLLPNKCNALPSYVPTPSNALAKAGSCIRLRRHGISSKLRAHFDRLGEDIYPALASAPAADFELFYI